MNCYFGPLYTAEYSYLEIRVCSFDLPMLTLHAILPLVVGMKEKNSCHPGRGENAKALCFKSPDKIASPGLENKKHILGNPKIGHDNFFNWIYIWAL